MRRPACTGVAASWCPIHGDCACPTIAAPHERAGERTLCGPGCPLHDPDSDHATQEAHP